MVYKDKISQTAREMIENGYGFRDDSCYNSGVENISDIVKYEVLTIGNRDILLTCRRLYDIQFDMRNISRSVDIVLNYLYKYYNADFLYAKWLTLAKNVVYLYGEDISMYKIPENSLIISDLGYDGCLFVSNKKFVKEG